MPSLYVLNNKDGILFFLGFRFPIPKALGDWKASSFPGELLFGYNPEVFGRRGGSSYPNVASFGDR